MKIILLNGPPYSGKDTAATAIASHWLPTRVVRWERFAMPMKRAFAATLNIECDTWGNTYWERRKEMIVPELGVTYRQWLIAFSEDFMKPLCGNTVFGDLLVNRLTRRTNEKDVVFVIPDLGFQIELDRLLTSFPHEDIFVYKISRDGCEWDSRGPIDVPPTVQSISVSNNGTLIEFEHIVVRASEAWVTRCR